MKVIQNNKENDIWNVIKRIENGLFLDLKYGEMHIKI